MATVNIQQAVDRIAKKTKELVEELKLINTTQDNNISSIEKLISTINKNITKLTNTKINKLTAQGPGEDFETFAELKAAITDDEFINIGLASGTKITGVIDDTGGSNPNDPIIVKGLSIENSKEKYGTITLDNQFNVTGGINLSGSFKIAVATFDDYDKQWFDDNWNNIIVAHVRPYNKIGIGSDNTNGFWEKTGMADVEGLTASWVTDDIINDNNTTITNKENMALRAGEQFPTHYNDGQYNSAYFQLKKDGTGFNTIYQQRVGDDGRTFSDHKAIHADMVWHFTYIKYD